MSHVVKVDLQVKDLEALDAAASKLGLNLNRGQKKYKWYGQSVGDYPLPKGMREEQLGKCDHALSVVGNPGAYEIGVVDNHDGTYSLVWDFFMGGYGLQDKVGANCEKLKTEYAFARAETWATSEGWMTQRNEDEVVVFHPSGGELHITADMVDAVGFSGPGCVEATRAISQVLGIEVSSDLKPEYGIVQQTQANHVVES